MSRTRGLMIAAVVAGLALAAWFLSQREADHSDPVAPSPPDIASLAELAAGPPAFDRWLRFEREEARQQNAFRHFYVDNILGHQIFRVPPGGVPPHLARELILDDDELLLSSGRLLWNRELLHQPGLAGRFCYLHSSYCLQRLFDVSFSIDGQPALIYANQYSIRRFPSHTTFRYHLGGVVIDEHKFITHDDRAVAAYEVRSADQKPHNVAIEALVPYPLLPGGGTPAAYPLLGSGSMQGIPLFLYLDAPDFQRLAGDQIHLRNELTVAADGSATSTLITYRFDNQQRSEPPDPLGPSSMLEHVIENNRWFAANVPYLDCPDPGIKKMWYYRWWIVRFHRIDLGQTPTSDLSGYAFYEGMLGFDNPIGFAIPAQTKELTYLRDPIYAQSQLRNSYRNRSPNGAVIDPPGSPYWGETYSHWSALAAAELHRVHPFDRATITELLPAMAADVRAWLTAYDADADSLPEREMPRVTGYDLDILSWWYFSGTKLDHRARPMAMERVDFASFVFGNAIGVAELAEAAGDDASAEEFRSRAAAIRAAALDKLWDDDAGFFYPQRATDDERVPIRELHGFFPFATGLAPNREPYTRALAYFVDPAEFWARFPPVITSQKHYREWTWEMDGLTRNIAPHPISMGGRTLLQTLKHYDQESVQPRHFMELLERYTELVYPGVHPNDPHWRPNAHEYYSKWEPHAQPLRPKPSDISHDFHSMYLSLIVEGAIGLTPRRDRRIELQPLAQQWDYFVLDGLRHRGRDLTIVWDRPGDGPPRYDGYPEGFSLYIDDQVAFTRPALDHVIYDPANQSVEVAGAKSTD